ncbi:hypothetical protein M0638_27825 [Roseomonas sp. NAR14]|uniref:Uncharacterized protein n=1 Tax=Roseomonas acroporae TaxID=2937791 RepID=A0A9X1YGB1_9PROT|nr:hypothetical protein [Roseomonas acroporae]MCK8788162.1 hypothetical protein [Roseomonas acroporae]
MIGAITGCTTLAGVAISVVVFVYSWGQRDQENAASIAGLRTAIAALDARTATMTSEAERREQAINSRSAERDAAQQRVIDSLADRLAQVERGRQEGTAALFQRLGRVEGLLESLLGRRQGSPGPDIDRSPEDIVLEALWRRAEVE